jgi:hypothetical protein
MGHARHAGNYLLDIPDFTDSRNSGTWVRVVGRVIHAATYRAEMCISQTGRSRAATAYRSRDRMHRESTRNSQQDGWLRRAVAPAATRCRADVPSRGWWPTRLVACRNTIGAVRADAPSGNVAILCDTEERWLHGMCARRVGHVERLTGGLGGTSGETAGELLTLRQIACRWGPSSDSAIRLRLRQVCFAPRVCRCSAR